MQGISLGVMSGSRSIASHQLISGVSTSACFHLATLPSSCSRTLGGIRTNSTSVVLRVPHSFRGSYAMKHDPRILVTTGTIGNAGNNLNNSCLSGVVRDCTSRMITLPTILPTQKSAPNSMDNVIGSRLSAPGSRPSAGCAALGLFGPGLGCGLFVVPTLVMVLLALVYNFLPTLGVIDRGRINAVRRVGIAPMNGFAFVLTGLFPC